MSTRKDKAATRTSPERPRSSGVPGKPRQGGGGGGASSGIDPFFGLGGGGGGG